MSHAEPVTGAEYLARSLAANGTTHVFFIDAVLRRTLIELGTLGVQRVLGHSEKAVAYMADGYARIAGRPGVCFAQSVGAANLASGLQDAYLGTRAGDRDDGAQAAVDAASERLPGNPARAVVRTGDKVLRAGGPGRRSAEADAAGLAGGDDRHAAAGASRPERLAGRGHRDRPGFRNSRRRPGVPTGDAAAPPGGRRRPRSSGPPNGYCARRRS